MGLKIHGVSRLLKELEKKFEKERVNRIVDDALTAGALILGMELRRQLRSFKDQGYTLDEMVISPPDEINGSRTIRIYWRGKHSRYRIIHLNEWGTIQNPNPRGKGKIAKAMKNAQKEYGKVVREILRREL